MPTLVAVCVPRLELGSFDTLHTGSAVTVRSTIRRLREQVEAGDIADVVARWTGIPVQRLLAGERQKLLELEARLAAERHGLIGSDSHRLRSASGGREHGVADAFRLEAPGWINPKMNVVPVLGLVAGPVRMIGGHLVGLRPHDDPVHVLHGPAGIHEFHRQPIE